MHKPFTVAVPQPSTNPSTLEGEKLFTLDLVEVLGPRMSNSASSNAASAA